MNINPRIPVIVNGKPCVLAFDMAAAYTLQKEYGIGMEQLGKLHQKKRSEHENLEYLTRFLFAMTRSMDDELAPSKKDIERMSLAEIAQASGAINRAMSAATEPLAGEIQGGGARPGQKASGSAGAGGRRSSRPSTASGSRRPSSGA